MIFHASTADVFSLKNQRTKKAIGGVRRGESQS
jgi:hypothetical protein